MSRFLSRFLGAAVLGACLLASVALAPVALAPVAVVSAQDHTMPAHQWNDHEDQVWHQYLKDNHKKDHDWAKASKREQKTYWKWRDQHPDAAQ